MRGIGKSPMFSVPPCIWTSSGTLSRITCILSWGMRKTKSVSLILGTRRSLDPEHASCCGETPKDRKGFKRIYRICICVDDFADDHRIVANRSGDSALNNLLTKGRHTMISAVFLNQKLRAMGSLRKVTGPARIIFGLRNKLEFDNCRQELSATYPNE